MVLRTILQATIQWDRYISCYDSSLVHLLIVDEVGVLIVSVEVHGIFLQEVIIIAEVRIHISLDVFTLLFFLLCCKLSFLLLDGLLEVCHLLAKTGDGAILLGTLPPTMLAALCRQRTF